MALLCAPIRAFPQPSNNANGNSVDRQSRLISCEHKTRRVSRTEYDESASVLADRIDGKRFNSPNDVVARSDGSIWFTDPPYGILADYEGEIAVPGLDGSYVYRIDPPRDQSTPFTCSQVD
jgi:gluconolactonase